MQHGLVLIRLELNLVQVVGQKKQAPSEILTVAGTEYWSKTSVCTVSVGIILIELTENLKTT